MKHDLAHHYKVAIHRHCTFRKGRFYRSGWIDWLLKQQTMLGGALKLQLGLAYENKIESRNPRDNDIEGFHSCMKNG